MDGPLIELVRAARSAGLRVSPAESIDAAYAVRAVGWADRAALRDALSLVLAKTVEEKRRFGDVFDLFFRREVPRAGAGDAAAPDPTAPAGAPTGQGDSGGGAGAGSALGRMVLAGDAAGLAAAMEAAADEAGVRDIAVFTQVNLLARRTLERMGLTDLERDIAALAGTPAGERLLRGREALREQARDMVRRNLELFAEGETRQWRERMLAETRLAALDRRDQERMRVLVRAMARRLAVLYGRTRRRKRRGQLDARRTIRRNMPWGGTPFVPVWKQRIVDKPRLVVLCDVSGSVATVAHFLLLFLYALKEALSGLRAFAFSGEVVEVSDVLEREPIERATAEVMARAGFGSSNYGLALASFERGFMPVLDRRATVIVLGDGRGNRTDPRAEVLRRMADRSKQVIWLNPEPRTLWGTGDSDMPKYLPACRVAAVCGNLQQLERVIADVLKDAR